MAVWLPDLGAVFIHIPKAGGSWVKTALDASGLRCEPAEGAGEHQLPEAYRAGRRFTFVRHPQTWMESVWRGMSGSWPQKRELKPLHRERTWSPTRNLTYLVGEKSFEGFVNCVIDNEPAMVTRMYESYIGPVGYPKVDFVGRQENLEENLQAILKLLGWPGKLKKVPPVNEGEGPKAEWSAGLLERLLVLERPTLVRWYRDRGPFSVTTE